LVFRDLRDSGSTFREDFRYQIKGKEAFLKAVFSAPGSPLHGKKIPRDWRAMEPSAKRRALVSYGYATSYEHACRLMGQHAAAVVRRRRLKIKQAASRRHPEGRDS